MMIDSNNPKASDVPHLLDEIARLQQVIDTKTEAILEERRAVESAFGRIGGEVKEYFGEAVDYGDFFEAIDGDLPTTRLDDLFREHFGYTRSERVRVIYDAHVSGYTYHDGQMVTYEGDLDQVTMEVDLEEIPAHLDVTDIKDPSQYGGPAADITITEGNIEVELSLAGIEEI